MEAAGLLIPLDDGLGAGLHVENFVLAAHGVQVVEGGEEAVEGLSAPDIADHGHPGVFAGVRHTQLGEFWDEGCGQIVHPKEAHILHKAGHGGLAGAGQAGHNDKLHIIHAPMI